MRLDAVGLAVGDIHVPAVGLPTRLARGKVLIGIGDSPVVLFPEFILRGIGIGIAPPPEVLNEVVPFLIVREALEGLQFLVGDDPAHILVYPLLVGSLELVSQFFLLLELFFVTEWPAQRVLISWRALGILRGVRSAGLRRRSLRDDHGWQAQRQEQKKGGINP